jgi:hypothetical protein
MLIPDDPLWLRIIDCYFGGLPGSSDCRADIIRYHQVERPGLGGRCTPFGTLTIDLSPTADEIFSGIKGDTRRAIRQAEHEETNWECNDCGAEVVRRYAGYFFIPKGNWTYSLRLSRSPPEKACAETTTSIPTVINAMEACRFPGSGMI